MSVLIWAMVGIAMWHFAVLVPDRFWGGIIGAFLAALAGALLTGFLLPAPGIPTANPPGLAEALWPIPGSLLGLVASFVYGARRELATDHFETIGKLTLAPGRNLVSCPHVPFGRVTRRDRLREEHTFVVERGSPGDGLGGLWLLFGGAAAIVLGVPAAMRWRAGTLVPA